MKRTVPLLITAIVGFVLVCSAFVPAAESWGEKALIWFDLLAGIAFILGGANLVGAQLKKISARRKGWGYAAVTLVAFLITLTVGVFKMGVRPAPNQEFYGESFAPLAVDQLPETSFDAAIPDAVRKEQLPPSVRQQVTLTDAGFKVAGWLSASQLDDLANVDPTLEWNCSIEKLGDAIKLPAALGGRLSYRADHDSLSYKGMMSDADRDVLKSLPGVTPPLVAAVDALYEQSNRKTSVSGTPPPGFELPASLAERAKVSDGKIEWTGPMSAAERVQLGLGSLRSRIAFPLSAAERSAFLGQLGELSGAPASNDPQVRFPLADSERDRLKALRLEARDKEEPLSADEAKALNEQLTFDRIVLDNWAQSLILALNTAGTSSPGRKSACELIAERNAGATDLNPVIPAGEKVELTAAQQDAIAVFMTAPSHDWSALTDALKSAGPFTDRQAAALTEFRSKLPTIGQRNRQLFDELVMAVPLTTAQRAFLLKDYHEEHAWQQAVGRLFAASHEVKYAWSGEFNQQGSRFWWLFEYIFQPIQSMMFALLAFYVASAAFRAFRAKNVEAILLLGTAFIILLGRTYVGSLATAWLPRESPLRLENLSVDIMRVFNSAGNRAIMIGIALGIASTSLKILLGIDRSHIGGKD